MSSQNRRCNPACACAHLWQLYAYSRSDAVLRAVAEILPSLGNCSLLARELIPWAMDWGDREPLWARVVERLPAAHLRIAPGA